MSEKGIPISERLSDEMRRELGLLDKSPNGKIAEQPTEKVVGKETKKADPEALKDYLLKGLLEAGFAGEKKKTKTAREWAVKMVLGFEETATEKISQEHRLEQAKLLAELARQSKGRITERLQEVLGRYGETFDPTQDRFIVALGEEKEKEILKTLSPEDAQKLDEIRKKVQIKGTIFEEISRLEPPKGFAYRGLGGAIGPILGRRAEVIGKVVPGEIRKVSAFKALQETSQRHLPEKEKLPSRLLSEAVEAGFNKETFEWEVQPRKGEVDILGDATLAHLASIANNINQRTNASIVTPDALLVDRAVIAEIVECKAVEPYLIEEFIRQLREKPKVQETLAMRLSETRVNELRREAGEEPYPYPLRLDFRIPVTKERQFLAYAREIKQRENLRTDFVIPKGEIVFRLRVPADVSPELAKELEEELAKHGYAGVKVEPLPWFTSAEIDYLTDAFYQEAKGEL